MNTSSAKILRVALAQDIAAALAIAALMLAAIWL